ncbi:transposase [Streptomyces mirabilis]|uniref:transposase n=1 Tax=Streptomyces mirabilis TaxID=68239 RepID=UPI00369221EB
MRPGPRFADLLRHRRHLLLGEWIRQAEGCDLRSIRSFADFLRQDIDAVTAGLTLSYSSGVVEGHLCRIKLLKRACTAAHPSHSFERGFSPRRGADPRAETQLGWRGDSLRSLQISFHCRA